MINKNFKKLFGKNIYIAKNLNINLNMRPNELDNDTYYQIAGYFEQLYS